MLAKAIRSCPYPLSASSRATWSAVVVRERRAHHLRFFSRAVLVPRDLDEPPLELGEILHRLEIPKALLDPLEQRARQQRAIVPENGQQRELVLLVIGPQFVDDVGEAVPRRQDILARPAARRCPPGSERWCRRGSAGSTD